MRFTFVGKNLVITDDLKEKVMQKISRIEKLLPQDAEIFVTISNVRIDNTIEVTIPLIKRILRAEVTKDDLNAAIDEVVDVLEKQMIKYKHRLRHKSKKEAKYKEELSFMFNDDTYTEDGGIKINKTKRFPLKPMDSEEAVMEMELLNHNFYVFRNGNTDEINVVYRRKNGDYGLIEPEF